MRRTKKTFPSKMIAFSLLEIRIVRKFFRKFLIKYEGGAIHTTTIRQYLKEKQNVSVGKYTYGPCLIPHAVPRGTQIGNYCSIAGGLSIFRRNHPTNRISQHAIFYNNELGIVDSDTIISDEDNPIKIGNDVWIGHNVIITPSCKEIGNGAIIASGSIVTKNVSPYHIVGGNPAKIIKKRFSEAIVEELERAKWWRLNVEDIPQECLSLFQRDADELEIIETLKILGKQSNVA